MLIDIIQAVYPVVKQSISKRKHLDARLCETFDEDLRL